MDYEYSDRVFENILKETEKWEKEFYKTPMFKQFSKTRKEDTKMILPLVPDFMYGYYLRRPKEWTAAALEEMLLDLFPRKLVADEGFYESVEPVLTEYFTFLQATGRIKNAKALIARLHKVAPLMLVASNEPENWGPGKQIAHFAEELGFDFSDEASIKAYMDMVNNGIMSSEEAPKKEKTGQFNHLCSCGSGKNFSDCHGGNVIEFPNT
ncbi:SEC-C domain-containing protein [Lactococcus garvieae]|uniref:SEC-C domain-containing protein n=1 Tax=Lactococcus garvieae TaxID=1363 RepID=UPI00254F27D6|nr:SEC-C domain-containing protein [Lactococcus garvieae]